MFINNVTEALNSLTRSFRDNGMIASDSLSLLTEWMDGEGSDGSLTSFSSYGRAIDMIKSGDIIQIHSPSTGNERSLTIDEFASISPYETIIDDITLYDALRGIAEQIHLSDAIIKINTILSQNSSISFTRAQSILASVENSDDLVAQEILQILATLGDDISATTWTQVLKQAYENAQKSAEQQTVNLDDSMPYVSSIFSFGILEIISTIAAVFAFVLQGIGAIISILVAAISWIFNLITSKVYNTKFQVSNVATNNYYNGPVAFGQGNLWEGIGPEINGKTSILLPIPGADMYFINTSGQVEDPDLQGYVNGFLRCDTNFSVVKQFMDMHIGSELLGTLTIYVPFGNVQKFGYNSTLHNDIYYDSEQVAAIIQSDSALQKQYAVSLFSFCMSIMANDRYGLGSGDIGWMLLTSPSNEVGFWPTSIETDEEFYNTLRKVGYPVWYKSTFDEIIDGNLRDWPPMSTLTAMVRYLRKLGTEDYIRHDITADVTKDTYFTLNSLNEKHIGSSIPYISVNNIPKDRLIYLPDYDTGALERGLAAIATIALMTAASVFTIVGKVRGFITKKLANRYTKLDALRKNYIASGSTEDWNKYADSAIRYNVFANMFGLSTYDLSTGRVGMGAGIINNAVSSNVAVHDDINKVISLIK